MDNSFLDIYWYGLFLNVSHYKPSLPTGWSCVTNFQPA